MLPTVWNIAKSRRSSVNNEHIALPIIVSHVYYISRLFGNLVVSTHILDVKNSRKEYDIFSLQIFTKNLNFDSHGQHLVLLLSGRRNVWKVSTKSVRQKFLNSQVLYVSV